MTIHKHDNFFRTVFSNPKRARKLLQLAAKKNKQLQQLLSLINLDSLRQIPGDAPREGLSGNADVAFHANLANSNEELFVGIVFEHKSFPDYGIRDQLLKYYFEVMEQKSPGIPMVAIVVYNGKERWNSLPKPYPDYPEYFREVGLPFRVEFIDIGTEISAEEFNELEPEMKLAMVAMKYVFDALGMRDKFSRIVAELVRSPREEYRKVIEEVIVYLKNALDAKDKEVLVDTLEALRNKGFVSIADAERMEIEKAVAEAVEKTRTAMTAEFSEREATLTRRIAELEAAAAFK